MDLDKSTCSALTVCHLSPEALPLSDRLETKSGSKEGSQMGDEGCPNEDPDLDDATGYSESEEEAFAEETLPEVQEPISSR